MLTLQLAMSKQPSTLIHEFNPNVTLDTVDHDCKVYCFVIGKSDLAESLKMYLQQKGEEYGKNLYVGFWKMSDPLFSIFAREYSLRRTPCIIMTAFDEYAYIEDKQFAYVNISGRLLRPEFVQETRELIATLYVLFIQGKVREAGVAAKRTKRKAFLLDLVKNLGRFSENFLKLLGDIGLEINYAGAKIILGRDNKD